MCLSWLRSRYLTSSAWMDISAKFILLGDSRIILPLKWMLSPPKIVSHFLLCSTQLYILKIFETENLGLHILCAYYPSCTISLDVFETMNSISSFHSACLSLIFKIVLGNFKRFSTVETFVFYNLILPRIMQLFFPFFFNLFFKQQKFYVTDGIWDG